MRSLPNSPGQIDEAGAPPLTSLGAERQPSLPFRPKLPRRRNPRRLMADAAYVVLTVSGWIAGNVLGVLGCAVGMFLVISHGDLNAFFLHLDNLTSRYVAADFGRREAFQHQIVQVFVLACLMILIVRGPQFLARLRRDLAREAAR